MLILNINKILRAAALALLAASAHGAELPVFRLILKDGKFSPQSLSVPAGRKFKLVLSNQDAKPAEFESFTLHREQLIVAGAQAVVFLGPLKEGRYEFFDDFNAKNRGTIEAAAGQADAK